MWPFQRKTEDGKGPGIDRDRIRALEADFDELRREVRGMRIDAEAIYEKTLKLHERIRKRAEPKDNSEPETPEVDLNEAIRRGEGVPGLQLNKRAV